jgi:hypothetical protein
MICFFRVFPGLLFFPSPSGGISSGGGSRPLLLRRWVWLFSRRVRLEVDLDLRVIAVSV